MHIYLTGASGFVGRALVRRLAQRPQVRLHVPIRAQPHASPESRCTRIFGDLGGRVQLGGAALPLETEVVVLNAYDCRFSGLLSDALRTNVAPMLRLLALCRELPALRRVVVVSTAYVNPPLPQLYTAGLVPIGGVADPVRLYEDALAGSVTLPDLAANPLTDDHFTANPYVCSKRLMEHVVLALYPDLPITFVRPSMIGVSTDGRYGSAKFGALLFAKLALEPCPGVLSDVGRHDNVAVDMVVDGIAECVETTDTTLPTFLPLTSGSQVKLSEYMASVDPGRRWRTLWVTNPRSRAAQAARWLEGRLLCLFAGQRHADRVSTLYEHYDYVFQRSWDFPSTLPLPADYFQRTRQWTLRRQ